MTSSPNDKRAMRSRMRTLRRGFCMAGGVPAIELPAFLRAKIRPDMVVSAYLPVRFEADPLPMLEHAVDLGARPAMPYLADKVSPMRFLAWNTGDPLETSWFGANQPPADSPELAPDIILTPLLAFDAALHRLGQGGGHYDRAFARYPEALRIGVAWSVQQVPAVPMEPWDVPLHAVVTERGALYHREP